jgi:hypothetical protein
MFIFLSIYLSIYLSRTIKELPTNVKGLIEEQVSIELTSKSKTFNILIKSLHIFISNNNGNT